MQGNEEDNFDDDQNELLQLISLSINSVVIENEDGGFETVPADESFCIRDIVNFSFYQAENILLPESQPERPANLKRQNTDVGESSSGCPSTKRKNEDAIAVPHSSVIKRLDEAEIAAKQEIATQKNVNKETPTTKHHNDDDAAPAVQSSVIKRRDETIAAIQEQNKEHIAASAEPDTLASEEHEIVIQEEVEVVVFTSVRRQQATEPLLQEVNRHLERTICDVMLRMPDHAPGMDEHGIVIQEEHEVMLASIRGQQSPESLSEEENTGDVMHRFTDHSPGFEERDIVIREEHEEIVYIGTRMYQDTESLSLEINSYQGQTSDDAMPRMTNRTPGLEGRDIVIQEEDEEVYASARDQQDSDGISQEVNYNLGRTTCGVMQRMTDHTPDLEEHDIVIQEEDDEVVYVGTRMYQDPESLSLEINNYQGWTSGDTMLRITNLTPGLEGRDIVIQGEVEEVYASARDQQNSEGISQEVNDNLGRTTSGVMQRMIDHTSGFEEHDIVIPEEDEEIVYVGTRMYQDLEPLSQEVNNNQGRIIGDAMPRMTDHTPGLEEHEIVIQDEDEEVIFFRAREPLLPEVNNDLEQTIYDVMLRLTDQAVNPDNINVPFVVADGHFIVAPLNMEARDLSCAMTLANMAMSG